MHISRLIAARAIWLRFSAPGERRDAALALLIVPTEWKIEGNGTQNQVSFSGQHVVISVTRRLPACRGQWHVWSEVWRQSGLRLNSQSNGKL